MEGPSVADGAKIHLWAYGGGTNQQWLPTALGGGRYSFTARNSGKCLDVPSASTADGVQLFDTEAEAVRLANDTIYGLAGAVFTGDQGKGLRVLLSCQCDGDGAGSVPGRERLA